MKFFVFLLLLVLLPFSVWGSSWSFPLTDNISYLEDKTHRRDYSDILRSDFEFRALKKGIPNLGYSSSDFWFRIYLPTEVPKEENLFLEIRYPLDQIEVFFSKSDGTTDHFVTGEKGSFSQRPFKYRNHVLNFPSGVRSPIYLKVSTPTSIQLPMTLWTGQSLTEKINQEQFYLGLYFGIILITLLFHFVMTIFLKDLASLLYGLFLLFYGTLQLALNRLAPQFLWPDSEWFNMNFIPFCLGLTMLTITAFAKVFLRTRQKPIVDYFLMISGGISFLLGASIFFLPYRTSIQLCFMGVLLSSVSTVLAAILRLSLGRPAILFLVSWSPFHVGLWALVAKSLGYLPVNFITNYGVQMASVFGILLFSISLADRFNYLRVEKEKAEKETDKLKQLSERNTRLAVQAQQVVHDIRSPLAALEVAASSTELAIPESERRLIQGAILRIKDITNQLSQKYKKEESHPTFNEEPSAQILPSVIEPLISEKRLQVLKKVSAVT
jgi:signal transduction histidine kinase